MFAPLYIFVGPMCYIVNIFIDSLVEIMMLPALKKTEKGDKKV